MKKWVVYLWIHNASNPQRLLLNQTDQIDLKRKYKYIA